MGIFGSGTAVLDTDELASQIREKAKKRDRLRAERRQAIQRLNTARERLRQRRAEAEVEGGDEGVSEAAQAVTDAEAELADVETELQTVVDALSLLRERQQAAEEETLEERRAEALNEVRAAREELRGALERAVEINTRLFQLEREAVDLGALRRGEQSYWFCLFENVNRSPKPHPMHQARIQRVKRASGIVSERERYRHLRDFIERIED